jgi:hypothetical protein
MLQNEKVNSGEPNEQYLNVAKKFTKKTTLGAATVLTI